MRLNVLVIGVIATIAAAVTGIVIALLTTERGRAVTATVSERVDPGVAQVRRAIEPGVQSATEALRRIPIVSDRMPASIAIETTPADQVEAIAETISETADAAAAAVTAD